MLEKKKKKRIIVSHGRPMLGRRGLREGIVLKNSRESRIGRNQHPKGEKKDRWSSGKDILPNTLREKRLDPTSQKGL